SKEENEIIVLQNTLDKTRSIPITNPKFKIGDSRTKAIFEKGYLPNWSEELYIVNNVQETIPITSKVKNLLDEEIEGSFYEKELQKSYQEVYRVEKVIRKKKIHGVEHGLVKWSGYNEKHNQWIPMKELEKLNLKK